MTTSNHIIEIPLTKGYIAIVDGTDSDLARHKWHVSGRMNYAVRNTYPNGRKNRQVHIFLHRVVLEREIGRPLSENEYCDHIDGNPRNNTRSNLRLANNTENARNRKLNSNTTSNFKGVTYRKDRGIWVARIRVNGRLIYLGSSPNPKEAHQLYSDAAKQFFGEFSRME